MTGKAEQWLAAVAAHESTRPSSTKLSSEQVRDVAQIALALATFARLPEGIASMMLLGITESFIVCSKEDDALYGWGHNGCMKIVTPRLHVFRNLPSSMMQSVISSRRLATALVRSGHTAATALPWLCGEIDKLAQAAPSFEA